MVNFMNARSYKYKMVFSGCRWYGIELEKSETVAVLCNGSFDHLF